MFSRLCALDRIPFQTIQNSQDIIAGLKARGFKGPFNRAGIRTTVVNYANETKERIKSQIAEQLSNNARFSLSLDEYTSTQNKRFMCLNLHGESTVICLGMIRVDGSLPAEKALQLIEAKLAEFGLSLEKHIFGVVTDGASMMKKLARLMGVEHQICHSHGLHLAVCDILYKWTQQEDEEEEETPAESTDTATATDRDGGDNDDGERDNGEGDDRDEGEGDGFQEEMEEIEIEITDGIFIIINKARKIIKLIRKSPVKNDLLQHYLKEAGLLGVTLILDVKTRWNSLLDMLRRFLRCRKEVEKVLVHYGLHHLFLIESEVQQLQSLCTILETVEVSSTQLGSNEIDLFKADRIIEFLLMETGKDNSNFGSEMHRRLNERIVERRNIRVAGLLRYLSSNSDGESVLAYPTKLEITKFARDIYIRLFKPEPSAEDEAESTENSTLAPEPAPPAEKKSKLEELKNFLADTNSNSAPRRLETGAEVLQQIKREMLVFETTGERPPHLEKLYRALVTLPPTSVEAERVFSAAGLFITKIRTKLSDATVDSLCFMRKYLLSLKK